jgi:hypothetical protein
VNDFKKTSYGGPCPPIGRHRYFHKLYALDTRLDLSKATKPEIELAMKGHVLASAELIPKGRPVGRPDRVEVEAVHECAEKINRPIGCEYKVKRAKDA